MGPYPDITEDRSLKSHATSRRAATAKAKVERGSMQTAAEHGSVLTTAVKGN